jgi:hypothetical protein
VLAWLTDDQPVGSPSPRPSGTGAIEGREALALERARTLLVGGTYLSPEQGSTLFRALVTLPGVVAGADARDGAGRRGTGISAGGSELLVFETGSFAFLGTTGSAVLRRGVTGTAGQLPS